MKNNKGFSLVELIVVVAIMAILAAVAVVSFSIYIDRANDAADFDYLSNLTYLAELYDTLGVFISLIVVNCIVLGRAEAYASKNTVGDSLLDAIGMGIGYTLAICLIALVREVLGTGGFTIGKVLIFLPEFEFLPLSKYAISLFTKPVGAFLVLGVILGIIAHKNNVKMQKEKYEQKMKKLEEMKKLTQDKNNKNMEINKA